MDEFDDLRMTDSEDNEGAEERVRMVMEEIYKNQDKIKSEQDIEKMAERCTSMMTQIKNDAYLKKKDKKPHRASGAGDKASPPPSRSAKESPRKELTTKPVSTPRLPKGTLKDQMEAKKKQRPNFTEMYKEKMDKLRVPGKMDLKGPSQNRMDSGKTSKPKMKMGDSRRKIDKLVEQLSSDSESESASATTESESPGSEEMQKVLEANKTYEKMLKDMKSRETLRGKEAEAHKKTADWISSTRGEQVKKKEVPGSSSKLSSSKPNTKLPFYSSSDEDSEDEKIAHQMKSKMTMPSKQKTSQDNKDALRKLMASMTEKPIKATATTPKVMAAPLKRATASSKVAASRPGPAADKAKPKKKI